MTKPLLKFNNTLSIEDYAEGYRLYEIRRGRCMGREIKSSLFFFLALAMLFMLMQENFNIPKMPVCTIVLLICVYMCCFFIYIQPNMSKHRGELIFKSSRLISMEYAFEMHKEYFIMKNEYETLKRYYTELSDCIETKNIFLLIGGNEKKIIVISKNCFDDEMTDNLSRFFQKETVRQYRRTGMKLKRAEKK